MWDRIKAWKTTTAGVAISGLALVMFNSFGCQVPSSWAAWALLAAPAVLGFLAKDK